MTELVHPAGLEPPAAREARAVTRSFISAQARGCPWCWLEDLNLPPLAYEASALPDELSQRANCQRAMRRRCRLWKRPCSVRRGLAPRPRMDVHDVKERGATGTVARAVEVHDPSARTHIRALPVHELSFDVLRLVLRAICPSCLGGGGRTPRRLFRFAHRALSGPIDRLGGAQIRTRAHEPPIAGSIEPGGGGVERGSDM